jgi:signal transduction histidine kinase/CheY-like chemotaxis protein/putative methionine-R-sulfoxide reductase with GAF domain
MPALVQDVNDDPRWMHVDGIDDDVHSVISAPITAAEQLLGVISVLSPVPGAFIPEHLDLLQAICQEIGLALSNARQYQQVQRRLAEITLIQNLAEIFNRRLDLQNLLEEVVLQLVQRFGYPRVEIFLVEEDGLAQRAHYGTASMLSKAPFSVGILGRVARTGQAALVPDVAVDPDYSPGVEGTVAELAVPICQGSVVIGVINIESDQQGLLTEQDRDLLQVLAGQVSIALENAVLYEHVRLHAQDLEHTVTQRTSELTELYELSQEIGYTLSYEELLRLMLNHLRSAMRSDLVAGGLYFEDYRLQFIETGKPIAPAAMNALRATWRGALDRREAIERDWEAAPTEVISAGDFKARSSPISQIGEIIHAPILIGDEQVGLLIAAYEDRDGDGEERVRLLSTFAHQAAAAIQRLKAMLAEEQKRLENLVEHLPVGVLLLDEDYRILLANPLGRAFLSVLKAGNVNGRLARLGSQRITDLVSRHAELMPVEVITENNPRRIFEAQVRPMGKEHRQWVLTLREVTQERDFQSRIQMQDRLATVGQMAAGIAHDFNNIMAAILVYTDLMRSDSGLPETARNQLGIIQQQVQRASSLIRQILDFSRRSVMEQSSLDLLPFIKELDKMLRRVMPETISLRLAYQPGTYVVSADPTRLQQALMNLAVNGRDAMPQGGSLRFELNKFEILPGETPPVAEMPAGDYIRIVVADNGVGITPENLPHIFEPFYTTKPVGQGTGLGLAQVYGIIKQHDGYIDVHSQVGKGTAFNIYLPAQEALQPVNPQAETPVSLEGNGRKVLVVEDDHATLAALQALLEAHHYQVLTASNGVEALRKFESLMGSVELVVSDVVMPQMGGLALYRKISEQWPKTKVLFITGHPMGKESQEFLENGSISWLQKPFSIQEFNHAVRRLAGERLPEAG